MFLTLFGCPPVVCDNPGCRNQLVRGYTAAVLSVVLIGGAIQNKVRPLGVTCAAVHLGVTCAGCQHCSCPKRVQAVQRLLEGWQRPLHCCPFSGGLHRLLRRAPQHSVAQRRSRSGPLLITAFLCRSIWAHGSELCQTECSCTFTLCKTGFLKAVCAVA